MTKHRWAKFGSMALTLATALVVVSPSYGFWFLFGYPYHSNSAGHYDSCCDPDYGYVYHHQNTHDEPFFHEQTASEHHAAHHGARRRAAPSQSEKASTSAKGSECPRCHHHHHHCDHGH